MLISAISQRNNEPSGGLGGPHHEHGGDRDGNKPILQQEERNRGENNNRQYTVTNHAGARVQIKITCSTGEHVENGNGADLAPYLFRVDVELVEERLLVFKVGGAAAKGGGGVGVDWTGGESVHLLSFVLFYV
ncbi:hypothetical protein RIF29_29225 [Crotalaria pallida]|uniref:Uncharacterized protein n=1 Tax=Crotalaria pallida TaxID=3830 RepID=A0AAN9HW28_CROPI